MTSVTDNTTEPHYSCQPPGWCWNENVTAIMWACALPVRNPSSLLVSVRGSPDVHLIQSNHRGTWRGSPAVRHLVYSMWTFDLHVCTVIYLRFSELNSDSRNLRNCSLPTGSLRTSSMPKAHLFTLCWPGSLLGEDMWKMRHTFHRSCIFRSVYLS